MPQASREVAHGLGVAVHPSLALGPDQARGVIARHDRPDHVLRVRRRAGGGPHVRDGQPVTGTGADPQHEVGERQVADQLPVRDEAVQVVQLRLGEVGAAPHEVGEGRHVATLGPRVPPTG